MLPFAVHAAELTALFGEPGRRGVSIPVRFERTEPLWIRVKMGASREVIVPALPTAVARAQEGEEAAVQAARTFLERADDGNEDGVWDLASATVKATSSRKEFVEQLRATNPPAPRRERRERFSRYEVRPGVLRIGDTVEVCFDGPAGIDSLEVRLDDDQEWRVAVVSHRDVRPPVPATWP